MLLKEVDELMGDVTLCIFETSIIRVSCCLLPDVFMRLREATARVRELLTRIQSPQYDSQAVNTSVAFIDKCGKCSSR